MQLIDLDQTIFVPIVDETKGGVTYEIQMTVAEFFDKFCKGFAPEVVEAVPVEWINWRVRHADKEGFKDAASAFRWVLWCWENQNEEWRKGGVQP